MPVSGTAVSIKRPRAGRPGLVSAVLRAGWEELNYPRARLHATLRRCVNRMRERRVVAALFWGALAGLTFVLYASGIGPARAFLAWGAFVLTAALLGVGGPVTLVHAWPVTAVAFLAGCVWATAALGAGALWLCAATASAMMSAWFAAASVAPFAAAGAVAYLAWAVGGWAAASAAFVASATVLVAFRRKATAPLLVAGWFLVSGWAAAWVAWRVTGENVPASWSANVFYLHGPTYLDYCIAAAAFGAALFVSPRWRERFVPG